MPVIFIHQGHPDGSDESDGMKLNSHQFCTRGHRARVSRRP